MSTALAQRALACTTKAEALRSAVATVAKRLPSRPVDPRLGGARLTLSGESLTVAAFDEEVAVTSTVRAVDGSDGEVLVSGRLLAALVETLPDRPARLRVEKGRLVVECGTVHLEFPAMPLEDYPATPELPPTIGTVPAARLARSIKRVAVATRPDAKPQVLTGLYVGFGERLLLMATDSMRIAVDEIDWLPAPGAGGSGLLPAHTLADLAPVLAALRTDVAIHLSDTLVGFSTPNCTIVARRSAEEYPGVRLLPQIPARSATPLTLDSAELMAHLGRANKVHEKATPIVLDVTASSVTISASGADTSRARSSMDCAYDGPEMTLKVNPGYLIDAIKAAGGEEVELSLAGPTKPFLVTPAVNGDPYRQFVMPIRL